jgi:hypothetical protein
MSYKLRRSTWSNVCAVKYLLPPRTPGLHNIGEYEYARVEGVQHGSFEELKAAVRAHCPAGLRCVQPIALLHELVWRMRLDEEDRLLRPLYEVCG